MEDLATAQMHHFKKSFDAHQQIIDRISSLENK